MKRLIDFIANGLPDWVYCLFWGLVFVDWLFVVVKFLIFG